MTHDDFQEQISQLIDSELGKENQPALFEHLSFCAECRSFLSSTLALRSKLATLSEPIPAGLDVRMQNTYAATPIYRFNAQPAAVRLALAASIAFILLMGSLLFGPQILRTQQMPMSNEAQGFVSPQQN
jgi:anti-sigma factor RsiW